MALALLVALAGVVVPLLLGRTSDLSFRETLLQIERAASVARADSQRLSEAVLFECRWSEKDRVYRIGTALLSGGDDESGDNSVVTNLPNFGESDDGPDELPAFDVLLALPSAYEIRRRIPEEYFERAGAMQAAAFSMDEGSDPGSDLPADSARGFGDTWAVTERPLRMVLAVFLPDGTLMGEERMYLLGPDTRVAAITMNRWLGRVSVERVRLEPSPDQSGKTADQAESEGMPEGPSERDGMPRTGRTGPAPFDTPEDRP